MTTAPTVGLLATCLVDSIRPQLGFAAVELLHRAGCRVEVPQTQTCCGQPALNTGDRATCIAMAQAIITQFESYDYIIAPSGSCLATIQKDYSQLFADHTQWSARHARFARKSYELLTFLHSIRRYTPQGIRFDATVAYHHSCSGLRTLGIFQQPLHLLKQIQGVRLVTIPEEEACCGFGGTFVMKYQKISTAITDDKITNIQKTDADVLTGGDLGCLLTIAGRLSRLGSDIRVFHAAEILAGTTDNPIFTNGQ